tara:strand:+ start:187 stop:384 length:198 start_codon:yes stop_codon:yes gene_type:complete
MYKISQEHRQLLLKYLSTRPYAEVFQLVALVVGLKPETNSKEKDREDWKETKGINKIPKPIKKDN